MSTNFCDKKHPKAHSLLLNEFNDKESLQDKAYNMTINNSF